MGLPFPPSGGFPDLGVELRAGSSGVKNPPASAGDTKGTRVGSLGWEDPPGGGNGNPVIPRKLLTGFISEIKT